MQPTEVVMLQEANKAIAKFKAWIYQTTKNDILDVKLG